MFMSTACWRCCFQLNVLVIALKTLLAWVLLTTLIVGFCAFSAWVELVCRRATRNAKDIIFYRDIHGSSNSWHSYSFLAGLWKLKIFQIFLRVVFAQLPDILPHNRISVNIQLIVTTVVRIIGRKPHITANKQKINPGIDHLCQRRYRAYTGDWKMNWQLGIPDKRHKP